MESFSFCFIPFHILFIKPDMGFFFLLAPFKFIWQTILFSDIKLFVSCHCFFVHFTKFIINNAMQCNFTRARQCSCLSSPSGNVVYKIYSQAIFQIHSVSELLILTINNSTKRHHSRLHIYNSCCLS